MKNTTFQILNVIDNDNFSNLLELKEKAISYWWDKIENQESNFIETYNKLIILIDLIKVSINQSNNFFDDFLTFSERNTILSYFNNLNQNIVNIKNWSNQTPIFIQQVENLRDIIKKSWLDKNMRWYPNYHEKLNQVNYLKTKYEELIKKLNKSEELFNNSKNILENIKKINEDLELLKVDLSKIELEINSIDEDVKWRYENIKNLNSNIVQYDSDLKTIKWNIEKFFAEINSYEDKIKSNIVLISNNIEKNDTETLRIQWENDKLQKEIYDILWKSIWTNLYKSFNIKSKWMLWQSIFWLVILWLSIYFLVDSWKYIFEELKPFFENWKITDLTLTFYLRLTLIFPSIYAVYFSASEFKSTNKLREEYDFKSAVSVWLHYFKDLVEKTKDDKDKVFLIDSIKQIFSSPTENVFWKRNNEKDLNKKAKDLISDVADITWNIKNKIFPE